LHTNARHKRRQTETVPYEERQPNRHLNAHPPWCKRRTTKTIIHKSELAKRTIQ
jgi:hypothetical protein